MITALGYYGFDNLGDELLLQVLLQCLPSREITVLSQNPESTGKRYGVAAAHRMRAISLVKTLLHSQWLVLGGGGLFQDTTSLASVIYYAGVVLLAKCLGNKVFWWAQGIGPLKHPLARFLTGLALRVSDKVNVRDEHSMALVQSLSGKTATLISDPVWLLEQPQRSGGEELRLGISLRPSPGLTPEVITHFAQVLSALPADTHFVLLPFQAVEDVPVLQQLAEQLPAEKVAWASPATIQETMPTLTAVLGMRFHSVILSLLSRVPVFPIAYDPKVSSLATKLNLPFISVDQLDTLTTNAINSFLNSAPLPDISLLVSQAKTTQSCLQLLN